MFIRKKQTLHLAKCVFTRLNLGRLKLVNKIWVDWNLWRKMLQILFLCLSLWSWPAMLKLKTEKVMIESPKNQVVVNILQLYFLYLRLCLNCTWFVCFLRVAPLVCSLCYHHCPETLKICSRALSFLIFSPPGWNEAFMKRFQLMVPVPNHHVTKNLTGHSMH